MNGTLLQGFEWYLPADAEHWKRLSKQAKTLAEAGFSSIWLPPAYKGADGLQDVGYGVYDTYDLGEFDQKGTVPTKYGTKKEYLDAITALQKAGLQVYADIVLNHRMGGDEAETVQAVEEAGNDRNRAVSGEQTISAYTRFTFPGRKGKYSDFQWNHTHFDGTDWDDAAKKKSVYLFSGKSWDGEVDAENGNFDYLMGSDLDMDNEEVYAELVRWGDWYLKLTGVDGIRLDAVKHIGFSFFDRWLKDVRKNAGRELFAVGEYWNADLGRLTHYLSCTEQQMSLFDVPMHFNFFHASKQGGSYDLRHILDGTLTSVQPGQAVSFVDNHDTQPGQALESYVDGWFRLHAYALILLREAGYPCVFYGDWYGLPQSGLAPLEGLPVLLFIRKLFAYGAQHDYFDAPNLIGWTREGQNETGGLAALLSNGAGGEKTMYVGAQHAGAVFAPLIGGGETVTIGQDGNGKFSVPDGRVRVYVRQGEEA